MPEGEGPWPGVVVIHEAFGLDEVMQRATDKVASMGFLALAPNLFSHGSRRSCLVATFRALSQGSGQAFTDIAAARAALLGDPQGTGKVGVLGFCMGGGFALVLAGRGYDAASVNYGQLPKDLAALENACPIVASYGGKDRAARGAAARLKRELTAKGIPHDVKEYPGAGHSFLNDADNSPRWLRPMANLVLHAGPEPASAADAWARIEDFFATHLRGEQSDPA